VTATHALSSYDSEAGAVDMLYLLDRLEEIVTSATRMPLSSKVLVEEQDCLDVIDQIKLALPDELRMARRLMAERDHVLTEANEHAERILRRAEERAVEQIEEHAVSRAAEERAHLTIERAEQEAADMRRQADEYAFRVLSSLRTRLRQIEGVVVESIEQLKQPAADA
jgi:hypothetical protein